MKISVRKDVWVKARPGDWLHIRKNAIYLYPQGDLNERQYAGKWEGPGVKGIWCEVEHIKRVASDNLKCTLEIPVEKMQFYNPKLQEELWGIIPATSKNLLEAFAIIKKWRGTKFFLVVHEKAGKLIAQNNSHAEVVLNFLLVKYAAHPINVEIGLSDFEKVLDGIEDGIAVYMDKSGSNLKFQGRNWQLTPSNQGKEFYSPELTVESAIHFPCADFVHSMKSADPLSQWAMEKREASVALTMFEQNNVKTKVLSKAAIGKDYKISGLSQYLDLIQIFGEYAPATINKDYYGNQTLKLFSQNIELWLHLGPYQPIHKKEEECSRQ